MLITILTSLFDWMYSHGYVPTALKQGTILTLYKPKTDSNSYRAITISSSILKLYEKVLLTRRLQMAINKPLHSLQVGFQPGMVRKITYFVLKESISYCKENYSKVCVCFLDAWYSFDRVWHYGLFFELHMITLEIGCVLNSAM